MKQVSTYLYPDEYKRYLKHIHRLDQNPYNHIRHLIRRDMGEEKAHIIRTQFVWGFVLYDLIIITLLLVGVI